MPCGHLQADQRAAWLRLLMMVVAYGSCIIMTPSLQAAIHTFLAQMVDHMLGICNRTSASGLSTLR